MSCVRRGWMFNTRSNPPSPICQGGSRRMRARRGQSLVEFAIISGMLIFLLMGLVDVGRLYITVLSLDSAAAEGVSYASLRPQQTAEARLRAINEGAGSGMVGSAGLDASITEPPSIDGGAPITCTVSYTFRPFFPIFSSLTVPLQRTAVSTIME